MIFGGVPLPPLVMPMLQNIGIFVIGIVMVTGMHIIFIFYKFTMYLLPIL